MEQEFIARQNMLMNNDPTNVSLSSSMGYTSYIDDTPTKLSNVDLSSTKCETIRHNDTLPFQYARLLFSQLGLAG